MFKVAVILFGLALGNTAYQVASGANQWIKIIEISFHQATALGAYIIYSRKY